MHFVRSASELDKDTQWSLKKFKSFFLLFDIELEALKNFEIDSLKNHLWFAETKKK